MNDYHFGSDTILAPVNNNYSEDKWDGVFTKPNITPTKPENDPFWLEQPHILFHRDKLTEFYPDHELSVNQQLNAITRLIIYFGLLLFIYSGNLSSLFLIGIGMLLVVFIKQQGYDYLLAKKEGFLADFRDKNGLDDGYPLVIDQYNQVRQAPTTDNPFMNVLLSDYVSNPARPPAANLEDPQIKENVRQIFNDKLYMDVNDIWEKRNSQRQFITQPSTQIPNDREAFAKWCFDTRNHSCRENYICKNDIQFDYASGMPPSEVFRNL